MAVGDNYLGLGNNVRLGLSRPDANLRTTALKMQLGIRPSERELRRYAQRQGVEQEILNRQATGIYGTGSMQDEGLSGLYGLGSPKTDMRMGMLAAEYGGLDNYMQAVDAQNQYIQAKADLARANADVADDINKARLDEQIARGLRMGALAEDARYRSQINAENARVAGQLADYKVEQARNRAVEFGALAEVATSDAEYRPLLNQGKLDLGNQRIAEQTAKADLARKTQAAKVEQEQAKAVALKNKNVVAKNDIVNEYICGVIPKYLDAPTGNVSPIGLTLGLGGNNRKINPDWTYYNFFKKQGMFDAIKTPADLAEAESQGIIPPEMARAFERLRFGGGDNTQGAMLNEQDVKKKITSNSLDADTVRNIDYEKNAQKPESKKNLDDHSWLSKFGDDLSKIPEAWKSGNFYSEGGWSDIATNVINSATGIGEGGKEQREKLYQEYRTWREKNPSVEAETFLGKVATGVANMMPLTLDMAQESALPVGVGMAAGSVIPGVGTITGGGTALTASMLTQSAKVGIADMYTSLRDNGIDDEDAMKWALWLSPLYGGLQFAGKAVGPVGRKLFGTMAIKKIVDRIADKKFKQKFANAAAKKLADVATITAAETATEAGQAMTTEVAQQGAEGKGFDVGKIAKAGVDEAKAVAPAMLGMAMLGIGTETLGSRISKRLQKKKSEAGVEATEQVPVENAESKDDVLPEVPFGVKLGETFRGADGKLYRNVDGVAMPIIESNTEEVPVEPTPQATVAETEATPQSSPQDDAVGNALDNLAEDFGGTEATANNADINFSLIGEKGIYNYGTEYEDRLESAKELDAQGVHPAEIWQKTGWAKNKLDGKWRYEITDGDVKPNIQGNRIYKLEDIYDARALYNAYPELREMFIQFKPLGNGGGALVNDSYIVLDNDFANNPQALKRILIHENQHWIQGVEGWNTGSAEQYFQDDKSERMQRLDEVLQRKEYIENEIKRIEASGDFKAVSKKLIQDLSDGKISDAEFDTRFDELLSNTQAEYGQGNLKDLAEEKYALVAEEFKLRDEIANENNLTAYEKYLRTAGEVEARNAEKRQTELTEEQRRKLPPEATQDFPYEEQIVFKGKNKQVDFPINIGNYFRQAKNELPIDETAKPVMLDNAGGDVERFKRASEVFNAMPMFTTAADGVKIKLKVSEGGSMDRRVVHMISDNATGSVAPQKLAWLPNIQGTIENAQVRLKGKYDVRKQGKNKEPNRIYVRRYNDGTIHAVVVSPSGEIVGQDIKSANVITQYPIEKIGAVYDSTVEWVNPNMTEASNETSEASHIKDLSHKGTVPSPKINSPTSNSSTISDSRHLSMSKASENNFESQQNFSLNSVGEQMQLDLAKERVDNPQESVAGADEAVDYNKAAEEALKPIFKDIEERQNILDAQNPPAKSRNYRIYGNTPLPKGVEKNKITGVIDGIVSPSAVRKYLAAAFGIKITDGFDTKNIGSAAMGVYYGLAEIIRLRGGFINDINVIAHEVGHYLEQAVFGKRAINRAGSAMKNELSAYCRSVFGETAYPFPLQAREGFAQFVADYLQNPEKVEKQCPITYAAMRSVMAKNSNLAKVLGNAQQMIRNYNLATPQERVAATTVSHDEKQYKPVGNKVRSLRNVAAKNVHYIFDRLYGLERAYRFLKNEIGEDVINQKDQNFYLLARLLNGKAATNSEWSLNTAQVDLEGNEIGKCLNDIINDSGCTKDELDVIFRARRAKAYYDTHNESTATCRMKFGITWSDVNSIYDSMTEKQKQACKEIDIYQKNMLNMLVTSGVVSARTAKRLRQQTGYVPLQRVIDEIDGYGAGETSSAPIKRFKGSDRDVYSPLEQIAKNEALFRKLALRNNLTRMLYNSITQLQGHADMLTEYKQTSELINLKISEVVEVLSKSELVRDMAEQDGLINANEKELKKWIAGKIKTDEFFMPIVWRSKAMRDDKRRVLTFYDGGEVKAFQVHDELLFMALKAVDSATAWKFKGILGLLHKISKMSASVLRAAATMNPDFFVANPTRDTTGGMVWTKSSNPFVFAFNVFRFGIPASLGYHREVAKEWYLSGGAFGSLWSDDGKSKRLDLTTLKKDFAQFMKDERAKLKQDSALKYGLNLARRAPMGVLNALETFSSTFESSARLTEFNQQRKNYIKARTEELVKQGLTEADAKTQATADWKANKNNVRSKAALESREITLDFEGGGEHSKEFNKITAFFNVTVLGSARVVQRLMPIDVHSFLDWLETVDLKQYTHDVNELRRFMLESKKHAKLSARAMVNIAMTTAIGSAVTLMTVDEDEDENIPDYERNRFIFFSFGGKTYRIPISPDLIPFMAMMNDFKNSMFRSEDFYNDFSYKAAVMDTLPQFIPTALRPLIEGTTNYSFFGGRPIEPQAQKNLFPSDRVNPTTSQTALTISRYLSNAYGVEISPVLLDFYVQSYLAGLGRTGVRYISDPIVESVFGLPEKPTTNAPIVHTYKRNDYAASRFDAKFAETVIDAMQAIQSYKQSTDGRVPWRSYSFENFREIYWYAMVHKQIGQINNVIGGINREVKKILNDTNLSADEKRDKIVLWKREKQKITKAAFKYYDYKYNKDKNSKLFKQIDDEAKQAYKLTK